VEEQNTKERRTAFSVALLLTWIAGLVDAIGFLSFARIYTANMSGNSVALGIALGQQSWSMAFFRFWPVLIYTVGLLLGRVILEIGALLRIRRIATFVFLLECAVLGLAALVGDSAHAFRYDLATYGAVALLAFAMGAQNAALTRFSSMTLHTGFVTGTLLKASSEAVKVITWIWERLRAGDRLKQTLRGAVSRDPFRLSLFLWITWLAYVFGAVLGTLGAGVIKANAVVLAVAGLLFLVGVDLCHPLAVQDETQQDKDS
jgi:uncharacterized membrane protein YoaK (UPF0700 family)